LEKHPGPVERGDCFRRNAFDQFSLRFASAALLAILTPSISTGEDDVVAKYYNFMPNQILWTTDKKRSSLVPMMYIGAARERRGSLLPTIIV
jgi:hypothetical protein